MSPSKSANAEVLLAKLVSFDTTSRNSNRALIDFIGNYLDGLKIESRIIADDAGDKACLWATLGPRSEKGVVLAGHTDTVPVDGQNWTSDPFKLAEREGRLFARGACDMKGFIACALSVIGDIAQKPRKKPIHLAFTHDEETTMEGAERLSNYLKKEGIKPSFTWIGEPTGLKLVDAHKGVAAFQTEITGIAGHSGQPDRGLNAIELGARFVDIIGRIAEECRKNPFPNSRFAPPYTTFNIGTIKGGTAENIIAEHCNILWQVRSHPGDDINAMRIEIDRLAEGEIAPRFKAFMPRAGMKTCTCFDIPCLTPTPDNEGREILGQLIGTQETNAVSFATEGGFFQRLGAGVIICGPGHIDQAHQADEYVEKAQLKACCDLMHRAGDESAGTAH